MGINNYGWANGRNDDERADQERWILMEEEEGMDGAEAKADTGSDRRRRRPEEEARSRQRL